MPLRKLDNFIPSLQFTRTNIVESFLIEQRQATRTFVLLVFIY
jgi:hypothetical protein